MFTKFVPSSETKRNVTHIIVVATDNGAVWATLDLGFGIYRFMFSIPSLGFT